MDIDNTVGGVAIESTQLLDSTRTQEGDGMKKQILREAVLAISSNAIAEIDDIPEAVAEVMEEYECEGEGQGVKVRLVISFNQESNTTGQTPAARTGDKPCQ
jgi:hypothetical protein